MVIKLKTYIDLNIDFKNQKNNYIFYLNSESLTNL